MDSMNLDYDKAVIRVRVDTVYEARFRLQVCRKEPWTVQWIESMEPGEVLYDVGASTGPYSLIAARRGVRVFAFEPAFANYARLCENTWLNSLGDLLSPLPLAMSDRTGLARITYSDVRAGAASHHFSSDPGSSSGGQTRYSQLVPAFALDDLARYDPAIPPPTYLKVDVDGAEPQVLAGARESIKLPFFRSALVECAIEREREILLVAQDVGLRSTRRFDATQCDWRRDDVAYHLLERAP